MQSYYQSFMQHQHLLDSLLSLPEPKVLEPYLYLWQRSGKKLRIMLAILIEQLFEDQTRPEIVQIGGLIEMLHCLGGFRHIQTDSAKLVAALASAEGLPPLDLAQEQANLAQAFAGQPGIAPTFLADATLDALLAALPGTAIFHFAGHATFERQMADLPGTYAGVGKLALDDQAVDAEQLGINLRGNGVRLAVLGGCETGRRDGVNVWSGVAPALVKQQLPAVVANQLSVRDSCAIAFSAHFYGALVGGLPIEQALAAGRLAAYNADPQGRDWGAPVLYMRDADGLLFAADDPGLREQGARAAQAVLDIRVGELAAGGHVVGPKGTVKAGALSSTITVGSAAGSTIDAAHLNVSGGTVSIAVHVDQASGGTTIEGGEITLG